MISKPLKQLFDALEINSTLMTELKFFTELFANMEGNETQRELQTMI